MSDATAPVDVLDIINRVAMFNGGLVADDLCKVGARVEALLVAARDCAAGGCPCETCERLRTSIKACEGSPA